jgi:hypothetical protein
MSIEQVSHTSLSQHTQPFAVAGATAYSVDVSGVLPNGGIELQMLSNGAYVSLNPPMRWQQADAGGTKLTGLIPANAKFRWTVPLGANANCKITSIHN